MLTLLKAGDREAYAVLYDRYGKELYAYAITLVKLQELAEDLVHDVFIKIWDARQKLSVEKNFKSYLYRVCHNRACDINKEVARNRNLLEKLIEYYQPGSDPDQELSGDAKDFTQLLNDALNQLTPQRRRIYNLCKVEKKSYLEVARELHIAPNTVKNHMAQILAILRDYFRERSTAFLVIFILLEKYL